MAQTGSFIPQSKTPTPTKRRGRRRVYLISYFSYAVFFGVILTAVGLLLWGWQVQAQLANQKELVNQQRAQFSQSDIERVREFDEQLSLAAYVMDTHPALSRLFAELEERTVADVQLTQFSVDAAGDANNTILVTFTGTTETFDALLFQRDIMEQSPILSQGTIVDVVYSNAITDADAQSGGKLQYDVLLSLPVSAIAYQGVARAVDTTFVDGVDSVLEETATSSAVNTEDAIVETVDSTNESEI